MDDGWLMDAGGQQVGTVCWRWALGRGGTSWWYLVVDPSIEEGGAEPVRTTKQEPTVRTPDWLVSTFSRQAGTI